MLIVWHDNGVPGKTGYTEEFGAKDDIDRITADYARAGITISKIEVIAD